MSELAESPPLDDRVEATRSTDAALVTRAQGGDSDAFAELVRLHQQRAVRVAYRYLGNMEDAKDVSQEAFVRAYRGIARLQEPAKFGGWLLKTVCNLSLNFRRSRAQRSAGSLDDAMEAGGAPPAARGSSDGLAAGTETTELSEAIGRAMALLPEKQRMALTLFSLEGLPQKEVAEMLDCSVELVKWNVFQARSKLKDLLAMYL